MYDLIYTLQNAGLFDVIHTKKIQLQVMIYTC